MTLAIWFLFAFVLVPFVVGALWRLLD